MSGRLVSAVLESTLPAHLKPYATACASFANDDGTRVFPSITTLARLVGRSKRATQTAVQELRRRGVLIVERAHAPRKTTRYRFHLAALPHFHDETQLGLFPQARDAKSAGKPAEPDLFHSHQQVSTCRPLHLRGEAHFTRSVIDPSLATNHQTRAGARDTGKRQKPRTAN
jgi:Helix-turn-helix domain